MMLFPLLPFCRQSLSARRKLLEELRSLIKNVRHAQEDVPRFRIRSLDVIPLAFSLPRYTPLCSITHHIDPQASIEVWSGLQFGTHFTTNLLNTLCKFFAASNTAAIPRFPPLMTWNPALSKPSIPNPHLNLITSFSSPAHIFVIFKKLNGPPYNTSISTNKPLFALSFMPRALTTIPAALLPLSHTPLSPLPTLLLYLVLFSPLSLLFQECNVNLLISTSTQISLFFLDKSSLRTYKVLQVASILFVLLAETSINFSPSPPPYSTVC